MSALPEEEIEVLVVQNADRMTRENFCLYMTHRHGESLGGMSELNPHAQSDYTEALWRKFHDRLHGKGIAPYEEEIEHVHED